MVGCTGSADSGSQMCSSRFTAGLGTSVHSMPSAAQRTFNECSAEKPDVPKKSTPVRSSTNCVMRPEWLAAYEKNSSALAASSSPCAVTIAVDDGSQRVAKCAVGFDEVFGMVISEIDIVTPSVEIGIRTVGSRQYVMGPASQSRNDASKRLVVQPEATLPAVGDIDQPLRPILICPRSGRPALVAGHAPGQASQPCCRSHAGPGSGASLRVTVAWISPYGLSSAWNTSPGFSNPNGDRS